METKRGKITSDTQYAAAKRVVGGRYPEEERSLPLQLWGGFVYFRFVRCLLDGTQAQPHAPQAAS